MAPKTPHLRTEPLRSTAAGSERVAVSTARALADESTSEASVVAAAAAARCALLLPTSSKLRSGTGARVVWCVVRGGVVVAGVAVGGMRIGRRACAPVAVAASSMIVMCSVRMVLVVVVCFHLLVDLVDVDTSM